jgi:DNA-binding protein H-NS
VATANLRSMNVKQLLTFREEIDRILSQKQRELEQELSELQRLTSGDARGPRSSAGRTGRSHPLKGAKIPPKFVDPNNPDNKWAGRGARPLWLAAALKNGAKLEDYAVGSAAAQSKTSSMKRSGRGRKKRS